MNHKRKKPKRSRSGCLYCKPHKIMGNSKHAKHARDRKHATVAQLVRATVL